MVVRQIASNQLESVRKQLLVRQKNRCAVCGHGFTKADGPVVDHDHETGVIRGVLHRSCNMAEGKVKVKANRGHKGVSAYTLLIGLGKYLDHHSVPRVQLIHPEHMTEAKKRTHRNQRAKILRDKKKYLAAVKPKG
jgi:hypothetical protein